MLSFCICLDHIKFITVYLVMLYVSIYISSVSLTRRHLAKKEHNEMSNTLENHYTFNSMEFFFAFKNLANMGLIKLKYLNNKQSRYQRTGVL